MVDLSRSPRPFSTCEAQSQQNSLIPQVLEMCFAGTARLVRAHTHLGLLLTMFGADFRWPRGVLQSRGQPQAMFNALSYQINAGGNDGSSLFIALTAAATSGELVDVLSRVEGP